MKFKVICGSAWMGVDETVIVEADNAQEAEDIAIDWWTQTAELGTYVEGEATEENLEDYEVIN